MINWIKDYTKRENNVDQALAGIIRNVLLVLVIMIPIVGFTQASVIIGANRTDLLVILTTAEVLLVLFLFLVSRKIYWPARIFTPAMLLIILTYSLISKNGLHNGSVAGFPIVIFLTGLLRGRQSLYFWTFATFVCVGIVGYADMTGITPEPVAKTTDIGTIGLTMTYNLAAASLTYIMLKRFENIISDAVRSEKAQVEANIELRSLQLNLEQRVLERTAELEKRSLELEIANKNIEKRAAELQAVSDVARAITSVEDMDQLLPRIAALVSNEFGFYHTGIFMVDDTRTFAHLQAASSEGGKKMLEREHKLALAPTSIVGKVVITGDAHVAHDTGEDAIHFENPDLPGTRSEVGLPLHKGEQVIGVLDVQSTQPDAFTPENVAILTTLADQIAIAIENTRLLDETRRSEKEIENLLSQFVRQNWRKVSKESAISGFQFDGLEAIPITRKQLPATNEQNVLQVPIKIREQVVGYLDITSSQHKDWNLDEKDIAQSIAERVGLAIENARLLADSQERAIKEQTISEIAAKISTSFDMDSILQSTVEELARAIPGSEVAIEMRTPEA